MALPLEVVADLQLAVDGEPISIEANGKRIIVDLASLEAGRRVLDSYPFSGGWGRQPMDRLREVLDIGGFTVEVRLRGEMIARMGKGARPGRISRVFNLEDMEVRLTPSLRAVARERPVATVVVVGGLFVLLGWALARLLRS
jgi:hypothetical protein